MGSIYQLKLGNIELSSLVLEHQTGEFSHSFFSNYIIRNTISPAHIHTAALSSAGTFSHCLVQEKDKELAGTTRPHRECFQYQNLFLLSHLPAQGNNWHLLTTKITLELNRNFTWFVSIAVQGRVHIITLVRMGLARMKKSQNNGISGIPTGKFQSYISHLFFYNATTAFSYMKISLFNYCFWTNGEKTPWVLKIFHHSSSSIRSRICSRHAGLILFMHQWNNTGRGNGQKNEDVNLI